MGTAQLANAGASGQDATLLASAKMTQRAVPSWCQFVPAEFQSAACRGSSAAGCTCSNVCKDIPAGSWSDNPECCGCDASQMASAEAGDSRSTTTHLANAGASGQVATLLASANMAMSAVPSWCHLVP